MINAQRGTDKSKASSKRQFEPSNPILELLNSLFWILIVSEHKALGALEQYVPIRISFPSVSGPAVPNHSEHRDAREKIQQLMNGSICIILTTPEITALPIAFSGLPCHRLTNTVFMNLFFSYSAPCVSN